MCGSATPTAPRRSGGLARAVRRSGRPSRATRTEMRGPRFLWRGHPLARRDEPEGDRRRELSARGMLRKLTNQVRHRLCPGSPWEQRYSHLTLEERCRLRGMMEMGLSISEIARRLGRHRSTIQRELARNRCVDGYRPDSAARRAWARKLRGSKIARSTRLRAHVEDRLAMGWSPEQIAGRMELDGVGARDQRGVHLPPCLQPGRQARGPAAAAGAAQAEARPAATQRPARARHPQPHADPSAADKGPSSQPVRPLGGRPDALPPPARHPADAAGEALPADAGPASSQQRRRPRRPGHRRGAGRAAGQRPAAPSPTTTAASSRGTRP